eukprot:CAMPEP_0197058086 /NCGR_PEP_ID=MMETSP1384-20130603/103952_1 /TAXON_ID=29189 /ORGANISM="Ammonia sp." /LENGTH=684 /DNA_ID=CAMNT_0042492713 /DNA_START=67 /DNA_END=2121 /DNA_ORIENTATION=-
MADEKKDSDIKQIISIDFGSFGSQATYCLPNNPSKYWICNDWDGMASCPDNSTKKKTLTAILWNKKTSTVKAFGFHACQLYAQYVGLPNEVSQMAEEVATIRNDLSSAKELSDKERSKLEKKAKRIQKKIPKKRAEFDELFGGDELLFGGNDLAYFEHFKPHLMGKDALMKDKLVKSTDGSTEMSIMELFELSLVEIKKQAMKEADRMRKDHKLDAVATDLREDEILWALSTPSVWDDTARGAFKECAVNAGMINHVIGLEPEFALFCMVKSDEAEFLQTENRKYLVLDCGGGTTDATCVETNDGSELAEVIPRDGRELGSLMIDEQYYKMLEEIFGKEFMSAFKKEQPHQWNTLERNFWKAKHLVDPEKYAESGCRVEIPAAFWSRLEAHAKNGDVDEKEDAFENYVAEQCKKYSARFGSEEHVVYDEEGRNLTLSITIWHALHKQLLDQICVFVKELLDADDKGCTCGACIKDDKEGHAILVGGLSQSAFLQKRLRETFSKRISFDSAPNASLSVVIGGLFWAYNRDHYSRRMWLTYGFEVEREWHPGDDKMNRHPSMNSSTGYVQKHVFDPVIFKNDPFDDGEQAEREYIIPFIAGKLKLSVFAVNTEDGAEYINEKDEAGRDICKKVEEFELRLKENWIKSEQQALPIRIKFKETMLEIEIKRPDGKWEEMKVKNPRIKK